MIYSDLELRLYLRSVNRARAQRTVILYASRDGRGRPVVCGKYARKTKQVRVEKKERKKTAKKNKIKKKRLFSTRSRRRVVHEGNYVNNKKKYPSYVCRYIETRVKTEKKKT